jgi:outer membrane biosynthesis protein TonB
MPLDRSKFAGQVTQTVQSPKPAPDPKPVKEEKAEAAMTEPQKPQKPKERKEPTEPKEPKRNAEIDALKAEMAELRKESAESNKLKTEIVILRKEMQDRLSVCEDTDSQILAIQNGVEQWDLIKRSEESKWKSEKKGSPYMMGIVKQMDNYFEMQKEKLKKLKKACVSK